MGVQTKPALKGPFKRRTRSPFWKRIYTRFDRLLRTTLALIEDSDPPLFLKLKRSRPRLWQILVDREEFHIMMADTDGALLKGSARHSCCR